MNRFLVFFSLMVIQLLNCHNIYSQNKSIKFDIFKEYNGDSCKKDLDILKYILLSVHPGVILHTTPGKINSFTDSIKNSFQEGVSGIEFHNAVSLILAQMHDGHTFINWQEAANQIKDRKYHLFPLQIAELGNKYYIKNAVDPKFKKLLGNEILSVNGKAFEQIANNIYAHSSIEGTNISSHESVLAGIGIKYFLIEDTTDVFNIRITNSKGKTKNIKIQGSTLANINDAFYPEVPPIEFEIKDSIAILRIHTFITYLYEQAGIDYVKYFAEFFGMLKERKINKLVFDVRDNDGGTPELSNELFTWLYPKDYYYFEYQAVFFDRLGNWTKFLETEFHPGLDTTKQKSPNGLYCYTESDDPDGETMMRKFKGRENVFDGSIITLINGGCYSTTGHFIALLKNYNLSKLMGTCSHGSYYSNDGGVYFKLPYTGISMRVPIAQSKMSVPEFTYDSKGICPDIYIEQTPEDLKTGFDRQLDEAIKYLIEN